MRQSRKLDHLKFALYLADGPGTTGFDDITIIHNCLPNLAFDNVRLDTSLVGMKLPHPVFVNAITGGAPDVTSINRSLAEFCQATACPMAVGSQFAALEDPVVEESYRVVRQIYPNGIIFANLGAHATVEQAKRAVDMIEANALQIHLNVAQEMFMPEGDRDFSGYLANIEAIAAALPVPVVVKEVGNGIAREQARQLAELGVAAIDVAGSGGTNFIAIEAARDRYNLSATELAWGIPTAISALEVASVLPPGVDLIISGGIRSALDIVKALACGGRAVGMAAPVLKAISQDGVEGAVAWFENLLFDVRRYMLLCGAAQPDQLTAVPMVISGKSREWLTARNIDIKVYANRQKHG